MRIFLIIWLTAILLPAYGVHRNNKVFEKRIEILHLVHAERNDRIKNGDDNWKEIFEKMDNGPTYNEMFIKVWKPLDSFYDTEFLEEINYIK